MALAPFFAKSALAAAAVLRGFRFDEFAAKLERHIPAIIFDESVAGSVEGAVSLEMVANLFARLYPNVAVIGLGAPSSGLASKLEREMRKINPQIDIATDSSAVTFAAVFGLTRCELQVPTIYVGSDGWTAIVSSATPVGSGGTTNPFGAAAAGCLAVANAFRSSFADQLDTPSLDTDYRISLLDFNTGPGARSGQALQPVAFEDAHLIGAGAIGNAALWTLCRVPELSGMINVVDAETIELSNVQRYLLTTPTDVGQAKALLARERAAEAEAGFTIRPYPTSWGEYLTSRGFSKPLDIVAVAVDSAADRISVQAALPGTVVNAWTQTGDLGVSRHDFAGDGACLACMYMPTGSAPNADQLIAQAIGLPDELMMVRQLLHSGAPINEQLVRRIAEALRVDHGPLMAYVGRPLRIFYSEALCGGLILRLRREADENIVAEAPIAFQSAFAGVLLAAALYSEAAGLPRPKGTKAVFDLLRPLPDIPAVPVAKHKRCICSDKDYRKAAAERTAIRALRVQ